MEAQQLNVSFLSWIFPLFLFVFVVTACLKIAFPNRFTEYIRLPLNNKYIVIYEKKERKTHLFTVVSLFLQWVSLSLFAYVWMLFQNFSSAISTGFLFLDVSVSILVFILLKLLIQKSIDNLFELKSFYRSYVFTRIAYSSYAAILMIVLLFFITYSVALKEIHFHFLLVIFLLINILGWITIVKANQKVIKSHILYFILYLCTLEIAPYILLTYGSKFL